MSKKVTISFPRLSRIKVVHNQNPKLIKKTPLESRHLKILKGIKMKKSLVCSVLCASLFGVALAGERGAFAGVGTYFGFGAHAMVNLDNTQQNQQNGWLHNNKLNGLSGALELMGGYKYFFTETIGLRGYLNVDYHFMGFTQHYAGSSFSKMTGLLDVGLNVEAIWEFFKTENMVLGIFGGLSGGFHFWHGGMIEEASRVASRNVHSFFGSFGMNLGAMAAISQSHSFELTFKIPFIDDSVLYATNNTNQYYVIARRPLALGARYVFSF